MKIKALTYLLAGGVVALAAWLVHVSNPTQAEEIPEKYRNMVSRGLEYLAKHQCEDGHWEGDDGQHPVTMTGLVGLALLMEVKSPGGRLAFRNSEKLVQAKYAANIRKAADWLIGKCRPGRDGLIFSDHPSETSRYMEGHGFATLFLAGASKLKIHDGRRQGRLSNVLTQAVKYIVKAQSTQGGWYHTSKVEGHDFDVISATVIQIQALQAAQNAGVAHGADARGAGLEYLRSALRKYEDKDKQGPNGDRLANIAGILAIEINQASHLQTAAEFYQGWIKISQAEIPVGRAIKFGRDEFVHYYYAQATCNVSKNWNDYRTSVFDYLQSNQNKDGSWPISSGISIGQVYSTALWCTLLQLDHRSHPSRALDLSPVT